MVFGSGSMTVPSTSIASRLATGVDASLSHDECRPGRTDTRTRSVAKLPIRGKFIRASDRCQELRSVVGDGDRVLEVGGQGAVAGDDGPAVGADAHLVAAQGEHRLDGKADARHQLHAF